VEVFPLTGQLTEAQERLLHARGGVSPDHVFRSILDESSPRPWRCFSWLHSQIAMRGVFSTPVEVFLGVLVNGGNPSGLLHARGGVSR